MSTPRVPDDIDRLLFLADAMGGGDLNAAAERQERQAQRELVNSTVIPAEVSYGSVDDLTALGFKLGEQVAGDPLFRHAELPEGWKREGSDHAMWSFICDAHGRRRCAMFFKGAHYDRRASISVGSVYGYVDDCLHAKKTPILDEEWATRDAVLEALDRHAENEAKYLPLYEGRDDERSAERVREIRARVAQIEDLRVALTEGEGR